MKYIQLYKFINKNVENNYWSYDARDKRRRNDTLYMIVNV